MNRLERAGVEEFESDARHAEHIDLTHEFSEIQAAFMIHLRIADQ